MTTHDTPADVLTHLGIEAAPDLWMQFAEELIDGGPGQSPPFLDDTHLAAAGAALDLPAQELGQARQAAALVRSDPRSSGLAWLWHRSLLFDHNPDPTTTVAADHERLGDWPTPNAADELIERTFPLLIVLSAHPHAQATLAATTAQHTLTATLSDEITTCLAASRERTGRPGLAMMYLPWLMLVIRGRLHRLGPLNYETSHLRHNIHVYRRPTDPTTTIYAGADTPFDEHGLITNPATSSWTSTFCDNGETVTGHQIDTTGRATTTPTTINRREWQPRLSPGDPTLAVHIPRQTKLSIDACDDSFATAHAYFTTHHPTFDHRALTCTSWMLDPRLPALLPAGSNLTRFQELFHLFPVGGDSTAIYWFVFGTTKQPPKHLPGHTTLQRQLKQHLHNGNTITHGGGIILPDDLVSHRP